MVLYEGAVAQLRMSMNFWKSSSAVANNATVTLDTKD